ncbi:MAG TPA: uroporphyrinogen-III synthase [Acidimicrobiales bacterium]
MHHPVSGSSGRPPVPTVPVPPPGSLAGRSVVVTRARAQASGLVQLLSDLGAEVVELPVIAIEDAADGGAALAAAADRAVGGAYEWVVVTSTNGVARMVDALGGRSLPASTRWAAVGTSTAKALMVRGIVPDLVPEDAVSDALVEVFPGATPAGSAPGRDAEGGAALFVRAERVRDVVVPGLAAKGWRVDEAVAYRTVAGHVGAGAAARARSADAVAFTSSSTVERTVDLLGVDGVPPVVVSIGPVTSGAVRAAGLDVTAEAVVHTLDGLVAAVADALS